MRISDYLIEIEHAATVIIAEIHSENNRLDIMRRELIKLTDATEKGYHHTELLLSNAEFDDDFLSTSTYWDTYFGVDKERFLKDAEISIAMQRAAAHAFSISSLSGSLLQYGKQGIALRFGNNRSSCPDGRLLVGMPLHEIIWQARNQALHWEEGSFRPPVISCFNALSNINPVFNQYTNHNLAYEIITLLGWKSFDDFRQDMMLFNI